jgi:metallo-beta-lactamase class B
MSARTLVISLAGATLALSACARAGDLAPLAPDENRAAWAQVCADWDEWDKPAPPYRIHGQTYYVGTCGISAILIVGDEGLALIDSGTRAGSEVVEANIAKLGRSITEVKALLVSHEHFDHMGGMARLQQISGAAVHAGPAAVPVIRTGEADPRDPQAGLHEPMEPVTGEVRSIGDGETLVIAGIDITGIATPGHTPGAMSWQWQSCEGGECVTIVYGDSLSPVSSDEYRFTDHPDYVSMFRGGIARLAGLDCDLLLTPHPSASDMRTRLTGQAAWIDSDGCKVYAEKVGKRLDDRLAKEAASVIGE